MTSAGSLSGLIKFIHKTEWSEAFDDVLAQHLEPACQSSGIEPEDLTQILGEGHSMTLWGCALEDFMARDFDDGRNVVDDYLKRRGHIESSLAKRYMKALRSAVISLYEVSDVVPGKSFLARDLIRGGEPVRVIEKSGSESLKAWDHLAARLVQLGSEWQMGGGILLFNRDASEFLIDAFKRIDGRLPRDLRAFADQVIGRSGRAKVERDLAETSPLELGGPTFTAIWLADALDHALNPRLPQLQNTDGDPIVMCTSTFSLLAGKSSGQCRTALDRIANLTQDSAKLYSWVRKAAADTKPRPLKQSESAIALASMNERGDTLLGSLEIKKNAIVLSTNSRLRASMGEALITAALRGLVSEPARKEITVEEMLAEKVRSRSIRPRKRSSDIPPNQARAIVHAHLDRHYRQTLDEPIPALGGLTPRQAARSKADRAKVSSCSKGPDR